MLGDQDGWGTNRLSKAESILGTGMSQNLSRGRRHAWAYISVKNPSSHTVHLANISILYPFGKRNLFEKLKHALKYRRLPSFVGWCHSSLSNYDIDDKCPIALEPGTSIGVFVPEDVLEKIFEDCEERLIVLEFRVSNIVPPYIFG